jgi:23S rRNA A2030 N6-methylase RlmJ
MKAGRYDHQTKAGNEGDVVKHPALVAALNGLIAEHEGVFRYADAFAGRWENDLSKADAWRKGIERFAACWKGGNPDIGVWRKQWTADPSSSYPGSVPIAKRILAIRERYEIRAFEIEKTYAAGLRKGLGKGKVVTRPATSADWADWKPDLLFSDPPGLKSKKNPCFPTLESLLQGAKDVANVLMWLPMTTTGNKGDGLLPLSPTTIDTWLQCGNSDFEIAAVRWSDSGPLCGCLIVYRFDSCAVAQRVNAAVLEVVEAMGERWQIA